MDPIGPPDIFLGSNNFTIGVATGLGNYSSVNASAILEVSQRHTLQVLATVTSSLSLVATSVAVFWFLMMQRNFRRDLVLLLILGGSWKSLWFVIFSAVTFARGPVHTSSAFCQVGGYCLQMGFEACDVAVFFMSMHMYYQIFPPSNNLLGHDGLYRMRKWVFAFWLIFPNVSAGLAFVNPRPAFMAQGAFCSIPLRPFWYRLGLFWTPRYIVWLYIVFVAVRIYHHVGLEFKVFGEEKATASSIEMPGESSINRAAQADLERHGSRTFSSVLSPRTDGASGGYFGSIYAPDDASRNGTSNLPPPVPPDSTTSVTPLNARRQSVQHAVLTRNIDASVSTPRSVSAPTSRRGSAQPPTSDVISEDFANFDFTPRRGSIASFISRLSTTQHSGDAAPHLSPISEGVTGGAAANASQHSTPGRTTANQAMFRRRRAIQRQLRLLFIYPVVYLLLWTIPFVVNVMNYTDYYAQHPVYVLQILQLFTLTIMTTADVIVFCWRERPWRHIPGSDGRIVSSFMFWRYCFGREWSAGRRSSRVPSSVPTESNAKAEEIPPLERLPHDEVQQGWQSNLLTFLRSSIPRLTPSSSPGHNRASSASSTAAPRPPTAAPSAMVVQPKRAFSGGSDRRQMEIQRAHERLAMERAEQEQRRANSVKEARLSNVTSSTVAAPATPGRKEWFDRADGDLFDGG